MSDNETNLLKWTAFASTSDPEAVGHTLNELAREISRLRSVCREAADEVAGLRGTFVPKSKYPRTHEKVTALVEMLEKAGKEATDGQ